jgi:hypothetical protein
MMKKRSVVVVLPLRSSWFNLEFCGLTHTARTVLPSVYGRRELSGLEARASPEKSGRGWYSASSFECAFLKYIPFLVERILEVRPGDSNAHLQKTLEVLETIISVPSVH